MPLSYYGFALFVFVLLCIFAFLCRQMFAGTKRQFLMLDEKEKKLLSLYSTLEDVMDEFDDSVSRSTAELDARMREIRRLADETTLRLEQNPSLSSETAPPRKPPAKNVRKPAPAEKRPPPPPDAGLAGFIAQENTKPPFEPSFKGNSPAAERKMRILALHDQGADRVKIAKELSVTLSEVDLVLGMRSKK